MRVFIETPLTDEILEGLEDNKLYFVIGKAGPPFVRYGYDIKNITQFSKVLIPKEINDSDIEKEADKHLNFEIKNGFGTETNLHYYSELNAFKLGYKAALSITETK